MFQRAIKGAYLSVIFLADPLPVSAMGFEAADVYQGISGTSILKAFAFIVMGTFALFPEFFYPISI